MGNKTVKILVFPLLIISLIANFYLFNLFKEKENLINHLYNNAFNAYVDEFSQIHNKRKELSNLTSDNLNYLLIKLYSAKALSTEIDTMLPSGGQFRLLVDHFLKKVNMLNKTQDYSERDLQMYSRTLEELERVYVTLTSKIDTVNKVTELVRELKSQ